MKRVLASVLLIATGLMVPMTAQAKPRVVLGSRAFALPYGQGWGEVKPDYITNGGDASGTLEDVTWDTWGGPVATGKALNSIFKPHGGYYAHQVVAQLKTGDLGRCRPGGPLAYRYLYIREPRRPGGRPGPWMSWSGSKTICRDPYARQLLRRPYWRHCGSQNHIGAGWYNVRAHNLHCGKGRKVARRFWHDNPSPFGFSCQSRSVGEELANVYCRRATHGRIQKVRFEVGA